MDHAFADIMRVASMYLIALFVIGYGSGVMAAFAFTAAGLMFSVTTETAAVIAASLNALAVAVGVAIVAWFGEFLAVPATYSMLVAPALYLAYFHYLTLRSPAGHSRTTRLLRGRYNVPFNRQVERGHATGDALGLILGAVIFLPYAGVV